MHDESLTPHRRLSVAHRVDDRLELLDRGMLDPRELETNLADLARLNRLPGGAAASVDAVGRLLSEPRARIVDVGTGAGDIPVAFARRGWSVVAVDADPEVLAIARRRTAGVPDIEVVAGDGLSLPFAAGAFDVAHCSLLLHHLDPGPAVGMLRELRRVSRAGIVVNDLRRGWLPLAAVGVSVAVLGRCRATRHDGILSVRRAYTIAELDALLDEAGLAIHHRSAAWTPRVVTAVVARGAA
jgi:SAM-dependent methyltransferase